MKIKDRNENILRLYRQDITYQKIGDIYGITRERVRQIVAKMTKGEPNRRKYLKVKREKKLAEFNKQVKFKCTNCGKRVTNGEANGKRRFCSAECRKEYETRYEDTFACMQCGKEYRPFRNFEYINSLGHNFCSVKCYHKFKSENKLEFCRNIERDREIIRLRKSGVRYKELMRIFNLSMPTISVILYKGKKGFYGD